MRSKLIAAILLLPALLSAQERISVKGLEYPRYILGVLADCRYLHGIELIPYESERVS